MCMVLDVETAQRSRKLLNLHSVFQSGRSPSCRAVNAGRNSLRRRRSFAYIFPFHSDPAFFYSNTKGSKGKAYA